MKREGPLLSPPTLSNIFRLFLPSLFTSSLYSISPRAAGPAFEPHLQQVFVLSITFPSTTPTARSFATSSARKRSRMPPKKKEEEKKVLLGRPGNSLKSGIVRMKLPTNLPSSLLNSSQSSGWLSKCRQIDSVPSHHKMLVG